MIWTTWRQHRAEAGVGVLILAAIAAAMLVVGSIARDRARSLGLPGCASSGARAACGDALGRLHDDFHSIPPFTGALIALPLIAGMFWAAPLVSREYESGTQRLAWTQSVSPLRWITVKIALIFGVVSAATLVLGLLATWSLDPLTAAFGGRYNSTWYDVQGVVPVACILFALAVGVAASALIRRTIPAMAVTLVVYAAARIPVHWIRWRFAPLTSHTADVPLSTLLDNPTGGLHDLPTSALPADAWLRSITITDPSGRAFSVNQANFNVLSRYCPTLQPNATRTGLLNSAACRSKVRGLSIHETATYQPASHFWPIQLVESAIFIGLAAVVVTIAVLAVHRRRAT
jgi:ABC-type transport system involved in multi-copper enzyme maturation permease subunit